MQAIEFTCEAQNGIISIPENYQDWFKRKSIKVILLAAEHLPIGDYYVSVITEIELLSYPNLDAKTEENIRSFLAQLKLINLNNAQK
jgi:hypothetical protein